MYETDPITYAKASTSAGYAKPDTRRHGPLTPLLRPNSFWKSRSTALFSHPRPFKLTRMLKFHIDIHLDEKRRKGKAAALHDGIITLHSDKLWIEPKDPDTGWPVDSTHHPFTGFYLAYPDDNRPSTRGMVSTITVDPPMLNWLYIDNTTYALSYANRSGSIAHHVGSFDWTSEDNDSSITFDGWEGFVAVEEAEGKWALYFDIDDDGLKAKRKGKKVVDVSLVRRVVTGQEVNKWGLKEAGNMGFRATKEIDKISGKNKE
ncbi:hypothetical protein LTR29_003552 [Friedmanniomyces endolithicus]|nr:hypothetical protein LTR29_003552 [Friedmanniomyces endolithicus]